MKNLPTDSIKSFLRDRTIASLAICVVVVAIIYSLYVAFSLQPSDLQVATRYTAFGDTHFYRNKWYYLLSFVFFGLTVAGVHIAYAIKLFGRQQRQAAIGMLCFTLLLMGIAIIMTRSVLQIAFL